VHAIRAPHAYDGESFPDAGATVLVEDGLIVGVETYGYQVPEHWGFRGRRAGELRWVSPA
jgi:hypothetical protein